MSRASVSGGTPSASSPPKYETYLYTQIKCHATVESRSTTDLMHLEHVHRIRCTLYVTPISRLAQNSTQSCTATDPRQYKRSFSSPQTSVSNFHAILIVRSLKYSLFIDQVPNISKNVW
eukprot:m.22147 g.22147  ORF g.22147 m.22147 type:complete len:119 (-) comp12638_c0_seq1:555-911(-)